MQLSKLLAIFAGVCFGAPAPISNTTQLSKINTDGYSMISSVLEGDITRYSEFAALAYCSRNRAGLKTGPLEDACSCRLCNGYTRTVEHVYRGRVSAVLFSDHEASEIILAIKGTTSKKEWMVDSHASKKKYKSMATGKSMCTDCTVHAGFYDASKTLWEEIVIPLLIPLHKHYNDYSIGIRGHSLGGSLGVFIGNELRAMGIECRVVTFGAPKIGGAHLSNWMDNKWNVDDITQRLSHAATNRIPQNSLVRISNARDVVPYLPSVNMGFYHSGTEILFLSPLGPERFGEVFVRGKFDKKVAKKEESKLPQLLLANPELKKRHNEYVTPMNKCTPYLE